jgi:hypothetical protein
VTKLKELADSLRSDGLASTRLADQTGVLLDAEGLNVFSFNKTGQFIVGLLRDGVAERAEIVVRLITEFEVDEATATADLDGFLGELSRHFLNT